GTRRRGLPRGHSGTVARRAVSRWPGRALDRSVEGGAAARRWAVCLGVLRPDRVPRAPRAGRARRARVGGRARGPRRLRAGPPSRPAPLDRILALRRRGLAAALPGRLRLLRIQ